MIYPILCKVEFEVLHHVFAQKQVWKQLGFSVLANWIICPFIMVSKLLRFFFHFSIQKTNFNTAWIGLGISTR